MNAKECDVVVLGGGSAGIAAAVASARNGARTILIEGGPMLGGELLTGMTIDGAINARGEQISAGVLDDLLALCRQMGGFVAPLNDWRLIQYFAYDPEIMKIAVAQFVYDAGVEVLVQTYAEDVVRVGETVTGVVVRNKSGRTLISAKAFVDASGDADLCFMAGASMLPAEGPGNPQPVSMMFRMAGVETEPLLRFVRENPDYVAVGESDAIRGGRTDQQIVEEIYKQGQPCVFLKGNGDLMRKAIERGELFATALIMMQPTSPARKEICINATRVSLKDPLSPESISNALRSLVQQVHQCAQFLIRNVPGFEKASLSGMSPRVGIRETRRIEGDYVMTPEDVLEGRKRADGVAKGCHHVDIHQDGTGQIRIPVANGGSYDIPLGSLLPKGLGNVVAAGRCLSASREAHGSARVMGGCMAMGQAAGTLTAMSLRQNAAVDVRAIGVERLRARLLEQGAVLAGTA
ncbi:MAG: FAD-dependent oxidoreductase [Alphaproteobacteria bacterium]|nr:FAD-dependent oxidoreductase [Alphaproteobacteria bacterium]